MLSLQADDNMVRGNRRIQQMAGAIIAALSLVVVSMAACSCSHHEPVADVKTSCHETQHRTSKPEDVGSRSIRETCFCVTRSNDLSVKSETFKLKKFAPWAAAAPSVEPAPDQPAAVIAYFTADNLPRGRIVDRSALSRGPPLL